MKIFSTPRKPPHDSVVYITPDESRPTEIYEITYRPDGSRILSFRSADPRARLEIVRSTDQRSAEIRII